MPRRASGEQWWAVIDADGNLVSEGSVLDLQPGQTKVKVDGPSNGRPWDGQAQAWGAVPVPPDVPPAPDAAALVAVLTQIAADTSKSTQERVDAILDALAAAAT